jgi:hypothetical protein
MRKAVEIALAAAVAALIVASWRDLVRYMRIRHM